MVWRIVKKGRMGYPSQDERTQRITGKAATYLQSLVERNKVLETKLGKLEGFFNVSLEEASRLEEEVSKEEQVGSLNLTREELVKLKLLLGRIKP